MDLLAHISNFLVAFLFSRAAIFGRAVIFIQFADFNVGEESWAEAGGDCKRTFCGAQLVH